MEELSSSGGGSDVACRREKLTISRTMLRTFSLSVVKVPK